MIINCILIYNEMSRESSLLFILSTISRQILTLAIPACITLSAAFFIHHGCFAALRAQVTHFCGRDDSFNLGYKVTCLFSPGVSYRIGFRDLVCFTVM